MADPVAQIQHIADPVAAGLSLLLVRDDRWLTLRVVQHLRCGWKPSVLCDLRTTVPRSAKFDLD